MSDNGVKRTMPTNLVGSRALQRDAKEVLDRVQHGGESIVIVRHGLPAAALVPIDQEHAEALVLASSPEMRRRRQLRESAPERTTRPFAVAEREIGADEPERSEHQQPVAADAAAPTEFGEQMRGYGQEFMEDLARLRIAVTEPSHEEAIEFFSKAFQRGSPVHFYREPETGELVLESDWKHSSIDLPPGSLEGAVVSLARTVAEQGVAIRQLTARTGSAGAEGEAERPEAQPMRGRRARARPG